MSIQTASRIYERDPEPVWNAWRRYLERAKEAEREWLRRRMLRPGEKNG